MSLVIGIFVISFTSCKNNSISSANENIKTIYLMINSDNKIEFISANNDSAAYENAYDNNEIHKCVEHVMNDITKEFNSFLYDPNLKYKQYPFVLWKITCNEEFEEAVKNKEISINHILNLSKSEAEEYVKKYNLSLNTINYNVSPEHIENLMNKLYNEETGYYYETYNRLASSLNKRKN